MFMFVGVTEWGNKEESGSLRREGWGEGHGYSEVLRWQPPPVWIMDHLILALMARFDFVLTACRIYGPW
jgi:hypothetical protein